MSDPHGRVHLHLGQPDAGQHTEVSGAEHGAGDEDLLPRGQVFARRSHVVADRGGAVDADPSAVVQRGRDFDGNDGVGAVGHRRPRHDADGLTATNGRRRSSARGQRAHHVQLDRSGGRVGRLYGVTVHGRVGERRDRLGGHNPFRQHTAEGVIQPRDHGWRRVAGGQVLHGLAVRGGGPSGGGRRRLRHRRVLLSATWRASLPAPDVR